MNDLEFYPMDHGDDDKEDYVKTIDAAYEEYRNVCYGITPMPPNQVSETKLAFLSGIYWLSNRETYDPDEIERALRKIVARHH